MPRKKPKPSKPPCVKQLAAHVRKLCRQHGIRLQFDDKSPEKAFFVERRVQTKTVRSKASYAVALHEIGHLVSKTASRPSLFQEGAAWQWARTEALCWTPSMTRAMLKSLGGYAHAGISDNDRCQPRLYRLPPRSHPFWTLQAEVPAVRKLLEQHVPHWLDQELVAVPWGAILSHTDRPKCSNCAFWRHAVEFESADTRSKLDWGVCVQPARPLGTDLTPSGALCGSSWIRR